MDGSRIITLSAFASEKISVEKFREIMQIDADDKFRVEDSNSIVFFETNTEGDYIVSENEDDFQWEGPNGEEYDGGHYGEWVSSKYDERIQMAADWMTTRQKSFIELQNLGVEYEVKFEIWTKQTSVELPPSFVFICGKLNIPITLYFN